MMNTTTIPTQEDIESSFLTLFAIMSMGMILGGSICELILYRIREGERTTHELNDIPQDAYINKYYEEFAALKMRKLSDEELSNLHMKIVREEVKENVVVIMTFDKTTETFWYYTDKLKDVSYTILETVAQKFAIDHDCKMICLQTDEQVQEAKALLAEPSIAKPSIAEPSIAEPSIAEPSIAEPSIAEPSIVEPNIFAKFKSYNAGKGSAPNFTSAVKVIEQLNHFRYRGKLCDYAEGQKIIGKNEDSTLDYASYKKLLDKKEN
jgi:hypothetical protein